jgi:hypothetical protein
MAVAILANAGAFSLWSLASRSPLRLARDLGAGITHPAVALRGIARFTGGALLLFAGAVLLVPLALQPSTFTVLETWAALTGLLVEALVSRRRA